MKVAQALAWIDRPEEMVRTTERCFLLDKTQHVTLASRPRFSRRLK
jgi:hypothetical protein